MEVCCAAVGTDCRSRLALSSSRSIAAAAAGSRSILAVAPVASPSTHAAPSTPREMRTTDSSFSPSSSLAFARKRIGRVSLTRSCLYRPCGFLLRNRRYRCIVPAQRTAPFFERPAPRFLADFIPIPRNKLADDHGGICLPLLLLICVALIAARTIFFSRFRKVPRASLPREKRALCFSSRFRLRLLCSASSPRTRCFFALLA